MQRSARLRLLGPVLTVVALLVLSACGGDEANPLEEGGEGGGGGEVVVGSANFPENVLLAEIYAQALEAEGVQVRRQLNIGSREVIYGQIESGGLSVLPEYNGALLAYLDPETTATTTEDVNAALAEELPDGLELLDSAAAENKDSVVVTKETAEQYGLETLADLAPVAGELVMGGPPEFETRRQGSVGLTEVYGIEFKDFRPLDVGGPITVAALAGGDIQAANLFTTDPALVENDFVVLEDPEGLFGAQNVTPLVHADSVDDAAREVLNSISTALDTDTLLQLDERVIGQQEDADAVAKEWLTSEGLIES